MRNVDIRCRHPLFVVKQRRTTDKMVNAISPPCYRSVQAGWMCHYLVRRSVGVFGRDRGPGSADQAGIRKADWEHIPGSELLEDEAMVPYAGPHTASRSEFL